MRTLRFMGTNPLTDFLNFPVRLDNEFLRPDSGTAGFQPTDLSPLSTSVLVIPTAVTGGFTGQKKLINLFGKVRKWEIEIAFTVNIGGFSLTVNQTDFPSYPSLSDERYLPHGYCPYYLTAWGGDLTDVDYVEAKFLWAATPPVEWDSPTDTDDRVTIPIDVWPSVFHNHPTFGHVFPSVGYTSDYLCYTTDVPLFDITVYLTGGGQYAWAPYNLMIPPAIDPFHVDIERDGAWSLGNLASGTGYVYRNLVGAALDVTKFHVRPRTTGVDNYFSFNDDSGTLVYSSSTGALLLPAVPLTM